MAYKAPADLVARAHDNTPVAEEEILIADDLLHARAHDRNQTPLICFPRSERGVIDYDEFTGKDLDRMVDHAALYYAESGIKAKESSHGDPAVIALLAPTDLAYIITFFALARLGYTILCLSPRLAPNSCAKLIEETGAVRLVPGGSTQTATLAAQTFELLQKPTEETKIAGRESFDRPQLERPFKRHQQDRNIETNWTLAILHSSGSTGLPKPIYIPHRRLMMKIPPPNGHIEFSTFPFFHGYGSWLIANGIINRKTIYMYNANLPTTADYCIRVCEHLNPDVLHVVPYTMELLALTEHGLNVMKKCDRLVFSGSACPDDLGNDLVAKGVNVETLWGMTEIGALGHSFNRPPGDDAWDYVRIPPAVERYVRMIPLGGDLFECVFLHGLPSLVVSNSNDPPGSFRSSDIFQKHPTLEAWKHIGRLDDRLTLTNGEKVLPVSIENAIRMDSLVRDCCVFGTGKSVPGILVFRDDSGKDLPDSDFIDAIWPTVQKANAKAESFSRISKETIVALSADADCAKTGKGSMKRPQIYRDYSKEIDAMYDRLENAGTGTLQLGIADLERWILNALHETVGVQLSSVDDDFFAAGINSLQAIQLRGLILKTIDLGDNARNLGQNAVYDMGNAARLAKHLYGLRLDEGVPEDDENEFEQMNDMIKKYSHFTTHHPGSAPAPKAHNIVLTGVTGSLGAHILAEILQFPEVGYIYCLVRGENPQSRVLEALQQRGLDAPHVTRIKALTSDLSKSDLGLTPEIYQELQERTTLIIHSAWAVNFNLGIRSFEDQHIKGVQHLIQLSLSVRTPTPAHFFFCSSIATALGIPRSATIPERPIDDFHYALPQGYARSKLVSEHIVRKAAVDAGALTRSLRIGQIVGDSRLGLWNDTEATPLMIRSALTLKALPALDETESWIPVDTLARIILDLTGLTVNAHPLPLSADQNPDLVYNISNPNLFSWTSDLLPALATSGLPFTTVPVQEWLQKLHEYDENGDDPEKNPAIKLIGHFERMFANSKEDGEQGSKFELKTAMEHSQALREAPKLIEEGYVEKFLKAWLAKWVDEGKGIGVESSG
ncbi:hypothetical protein ACLMJK_005305 [Lecanora helva]